MTAAEPVSPEQWRAAVDLVSRFEESVDRRDADAFASWFTADGSMTGEMQADPGHLRDVGSGHDAAGPPLMHLTANHVVERGSGDTLRVRYLLVVLALEPAGPTLLRVNRITDLLQRMPEGWRIQLHHVAPADVTTPAPGQAPLDGAEPG